MAACPNLRMLQVFQSLDHVAPYGSTLHRCLPRHLTYVVMYIWHQTNGQGRTTCSYTWEGHKGGLIERADCGFRRKHDHVCIHRWLCVCLRLQSKLLVNSPAYPMSISFAAFALLMTPAAMACLRPLQLIIDGCIAHLLVLGRLRWWCCQSCRSVHRQLNSAESASAGELPCHKSPTALRHSAAGLSVTWLLSLHSTGWSSGIDKYCAYLILSSVWI